MSLKEPLIYHPTVGHNNYWIRSDWAAKVRSYHYGRPEIRVLVCPLTKLVARITHQYWANGFAYRVEILDRGCADLREFGAPIISSYVKAPQTPDKTLVLQP